MTGIVSDSNIRPDTDSKPDCEVCYIRDEATAWNFSKSLPQGTSLVVQWLRLCIPNAGGPGSIPGQGTKSRMHATLRVCMLQLKILHAVTKTQRSQIKKSLPR